MTSKKEYPPTVLARPLDQSLAPLYLAVGKAVGKWAGVELTLASILQRLTGLDDMTARNIIFSSSSFEGKLRIVRAALRSARLSAEEESYLGRLLKVADTYSQTRNAIVHRIPTLRIGKERAAILLEGQRRPEDLGRVGPAITVDQVQTASVNFAKLSWLLSEARRAQNLDDPEKHFAELLPLAELLPNDPLSLAPSENQRGRKRQQQATAKGLIPKKTPQKPVSRD